MKKFIKNILVQKRTKQYKERVRYLKNIRGEYDRLEETASKKDAKIESVFSVCTVSYSDIKSLTEKRDCDIVIMYSEKNGEVCGYAKDEICRFFADNTETSLVYGDELIIDDSGAERIYSAFYHKPDWSPDSYLDAFYVGNFFAFRISLLEKIRNDITSDCNADKLFGMLAIAAGGFECRQGMDFPIGHISKTLYRSYIDSDVFQGRPFGGNVKAPAVPETVPSSDGVSIVIPSKDHPEVFDVCMKSLTNTVSETDYEIILVDNGSSDENKARYEECLSFISGASVCKGTSYIYEKEDFNFSRMCNKGAAAAKYENILFLNDDIECLNNDSGEWLTRLCSIMNRTWTGAVGSKLLYPERNLIQHAGITNTCFGPLHKYQKFSDEKEYYFGFNRGVHDLVGVTGACLMMQKTLFNELGGFDESFAVAFNDVDLCFRIIEKGYYIACDNDIFLYHHESLSRGYDGDDPVKNKRMKRELRHLYSLHPDMFRADPFYNKNLVGTVTPTIRVKDLPLPEELPYSKAEVLKSMEGFTEDACLNVSVESKGPVSKLYGEFSKDYDKCGYYISGFSFVIGSDNACFDKELLLKNSENGTVYRLNINELYRKDVDDNLEDQVNTELTGFGVRIEDDAVPKGIYEIGMVAYDRTGRLKLVNWSDLLFYVGIQDPAWGEE